MSYTIESQYVNLRTHTQYARRLRHYLILQINKTFVLIIKLVSQEKTFLWILHVIEKQHDKKLFSQQKLHPQTCHYSHTIFI